MRLCFLITVFTLIVVSCGKKNNDSGVEYCSRRQYAHSECVRVYTRTYGYEYTRDMCTRQVAQVACN